ncbi:hypothetical protein D3C86_1223300 [compost metagenome]
MVLEIRLDAVGAQQIEIRRQTQRQVHGPEPAARGLQLARIIRQLVEPHLAIEPHPVGGVIGLARGQGFHLVHQHALAAQQHLPLRQPLGRGQQILLIPSQDQQQLHIGVVGGADHVDGGPLHLGVVDQEIGTRVIGGEDHPVAIRQLVDEHGEVLTPPLRLGTEPGRQHGRRLLLQERDCAAEHHGQDQLAVVPHVEERHGEEGEFVAHRQGLQLQVQLAVPVDVEPQGIARRVLAHLLVMADEAHLDPVEILGVARIQLDAGMGTFPHLRLGEGGNPHQLVIEVDLDLGEQRQQGGGRGEVEIQAGPGDHLVPPHGEVRLAVRCVAAQGEGARGRGHLFETQRLTAHRREHGWQGAAGLGGQRTLRHQQQRDKVALWFHHPFTVCVVGAPDRKPGETRRGTKESSQRTSFSSRIQTNPMGEARARRQ